MVKKSGIKTDAELYKAKINLIEKDDELADTVDKLTESLDQLSKEILDMASMKTSIIGKYSPEDIANSNFSDEDKATLSSIYSTTKDKKTQQRKLQDIIDRKTKFRFK